VIKPVPRSSSPELLMAPAAAGAVAGASAAASALAAGGGLTAEAFLFKVPGRGLAAVGTHRLIPPGHGQKLLEGASAVGTHEGIHGQTRSLPFSAWSAFRAYISIIYALGVFCKGQVGISVKGRRDSCKTFGGSAAQWYINYPRPKGGRMGFQRAWALWRRV